MFDTILKNICAVTLLLLFVFFVYDLCKYFVLKIKEKNKPVIIEKKESEKNESKKEKKEKE